MADPTIRCEECGVAVVDGLRCPECGCWVCPECSAMHMQACGSGRERMNRRNSPGALIASMGLGLTFCGACYGLMDLAIWLSRILNWSPPFWAALMAVGVMVVIIGAIIDRYEGRNG